MDKLKLIYWFQDSSIELPDHFIELLSERMIIYLQDGLASKKRLPIFSEEITSDLNKVFTAFKTPLEKEDEGLFKKLLTKTSLKDLLILAGQRITPGSITDKNAIPPEKEKLLSSFQEMFNKELTIGARAWTKHTERSEENFWGVIKGSSTEKNQKAFKIINQIIENHSWWNTFGHYAQDYVFELRLPSGHGARWKADGSFFIGFLEPFLEGEN